MAFVDVVQFVPSHGGEWWTQGRGTFFFVQHHYLFVKPYMQMRGGLLFSDLHRGWYHIVQWQFWVILTEYGVGNSNFVF